MNSSVIVRAAVVLAVLCVVLLPALPAGAQDGQATITVQADKPGITISPTLYGIFYEEINCAGDGGLYAELVRNRSLEDSDKPDHWSSLSAGGLKADLAVEKGKPSTASPFNTRYLRVKVSGEGAGQAGAINGGWWGMGLAKDAAYDLTFFARGGDDFKGPLVVCLQSADGQAAYAQAKVDLTAEWKRHTVRLTSSAHDPKARLVLASAGPGTFYLDVVSLFPVKTFKDRPNGLRVDLAGMLADMKPSFIRFPGGCWVEGNTMAEAQRWKQTIGDIADRRTQGNLWGYMATNGLAFHEYLQLCEDLGAEPLFVINVGMSHRENVPMDQMGPYVQDALDAIEYATGPADSQWGSLRAKAGHPAPFKLNYMEIGNENGGPAYHERYALFHDAIKAKYPAIHLVADVWGGVPGNRKLEIVDEHYYSSPEFFIQNAFKYDSYDRQKGQVYVGEYAVTQGCGQGNLRAAVGEAAFMCGMERNSDVVVLASYAPLLANVNHKGWNPDAICFDSSRCYGTPSYHVQKMFSRHRGDVVLPVEVRAEEKAPVGKKGSIGVGTWVTQAQYKDIQVVRGEQVLYRSDFAAGAGGGKVDGGVWKTADGCLVQTSDATDCRWFVPGKDWDTYTYSLKARKTGGAEGFLIMFAVKGHNDFLWWNLGGWGNHKHAIENAEGGGKATLVERPGQIETGRWYDIRLEVRPEGVRCFLDGKKIHDVTFPRVRPLYATASLDKAGGEVILKAVNTSASTVRTQVELAGLAGVEGPVRAEVLTSDNPMDENTLDEPAKVAPRTITIPSAGKAFTVDLPGNSVTILRAKARQ